MKRKLSSVMLTSLLCLTMMMGFTPAAQALDSLPKLPAYLVETGTVLSITQRVDTDGSPIEGSFFVRLETGTAEESIPVVFIVDNDTLRLDQNELKIGSTVTGWYNGRLPVILIYPSQYSAVAISVDAEQLPFAKLDTFDENLISYDGDLKLNLSEQTVITLADGSIFEGSLANCDLAVFYTATTRSIPAQTTPSKIIVLNQPAPEPEIEPYDLANLTTEDLTAVPLMVEGQILQNAPPAILSEEGALLVPLRAIADALGYEVQWDAETAGVSLNSAILLNIGTDHYTLADGTTTTLGIAPQLANGLTYVPLPFFKQVMQLNNAYFFEGTIVVDNGELMA